jgi:hypothetical protein
MEQEKILVDNEKSCEKCPKKLTKESCTYCKYFLLYEREITDIYDNVEPNLDDFYCALEQDVDQIIGVEPSQEDLLEGSLEETGETEILSIDNDKIIIENPKKEENKLKKLHLKFPVIKKTVKNVLDLTVYKRRERKFLNGIKNASVTDVLIESSLSATRPEKDIQEKVHNDMNTTRIRKRIAKFVRIKPKNTRNQLWDNTKTKTLVKNIGIISLLCVLLLPRYLWTPELKFTRDFSFFSAIVLWTSFFVFLYCAIFFLKLLLLRKNKGKPKNKISLIKSLKTFRSELESKGLVFYKRRKSAQYFFEYMDKKVYNKNKKIYAKNLSADIDNIEETIRQKAHKSTTKCDLFYLFINQFYSKKTSKSKESIKDNRPKLRVIKSEIVRFNNALTSYGNIEVSDKTLEKERDASITIPAASKEDLKLIKALNKEITLKSAQIPYYNDMESREQYEKELIEKYEEKKQAESFELIRLKKEKENYSKLSKTLESDSGKNISIVSSLKKWFTDKRQAKDKNVKFQVDQYFKGKQINKGRTEYCSKEKLKVRTEIKAVIGYNKATSVKDVMENRKIYQDKIKVWYKDKKKGLSSKKTYQEKLKSWYKDLKKKLNTKTKKKELPDKKIIFVDIEPPKRSSQVIRTAPLVQHRARFDFNFKVIASVLQKSLIPLAVLLLAFIVFISSDKLLFTRDIILSFDFLIVLIPALYVSIITAKLILSKRRTIILASVPALTLLGAIILVAAGLENLVGFLVLASVILSYVLVANQVKINKSKKFRLPKMNTDYYRLLYHRHKFFLVYYTTDTSSFY